MTYKEIIKLVDAPKDEHHVKRMDVEYFGRFAIMTSDKTDAIIVDSDIARKVSNRRWCIDSGGYPTTNINGRTVRLFDYVMAHYFDEKPKGCFVDHVNQDKLDNRRNNLRIVTVHENAQNMPVRFDNKTGHTGVCRNRNGRYRAYITVRQKQLSLGCYGTLEEAIAARREAETRLGFKTRPYRIKDLCEVHHEHD